MNWNVTYRAKDGKQTADVFEAESREALFTVLASKGISPIRIEKTNNAKRSQVSAGYMKLIPRAALCIAVILAFFFAWKFLGPNDTVTDQQDSDRKSNQISTPVPTLHHLIKTNSGEVASKDDDLGFRTNRFGEVVRRVKPETYVDARGILRYKNGNARVPNPDDFKNPIRIERSTGLPHFNHPVEDEIATLISVAPGETLVGEISYRGFDRDFVNSLLDKIEFSEDDSEYDREIKQGVIEVKKDLAARIKNGEDLVQILKDARSELMRSAEYKNQIGDLVHEQLLDPTVSDEELKDSIAAANKRLESKGLAPIKETKFLRARERVLLVQERKAAMSPQN